MPKTAILSLVAMSVCVLAYCLAPDASLMERLSGVSIGLLGILFIGAMLIGQRFHFDPHLD